MQPLKDQNKMAWPNSRICVGCREIFNKENCKIDISEFWNNREQTVFACSKRCANHAKDNWLKRV